MNHLDKLTELHTAMSCRIGLPVENLAHGYRQAVSSPIFSTAIGLLQRGLQDVDYNAKAAEEVPSATLFDNVQERNEHQSNATETNIKAPSNVSEEKSPGWLENVFRKTKEWFEAEPDIDFKK